MPLNYMRHWPTVVVYAEQESKAERERAKTETETA